MFIWTAKQVPGKIFLFKKILFALNTGSLCIAQKYLHFTNSLL